MTWMAVKLARAEIEKGAWNRLQQGFEKVFTAAMAPTEAALFLFGKPAGQRTFYFSPEAAKLFGSQLKGYRAVECDPPSRDGLMLLGGHQDTAFSLLRS